MRQAIPKRFSQLCPTQVLGKAYIKGNKNKAGAKKTQIPKKIDAQ
jgi:hypothetical protein